MPCRERYWPIYVRSFVVGSGGSVPRGIIHIREPDIGTPLIRPFTMAEANWACLSAPNSVTPGFGLISL